MGKELANNKTASDVSDVNSLLENDLGVPLALHISLSRPLTLKTAEKDAFIGKLKQTVNDSNIKAFDTRAKDLAWHPNESNSRWFLVLRLQESAALCNLLEMCNAVAQDFGQPLLYSDLEGSKTRTEVSQFHISLAWSLQPPMSTSKSRESDTPHSKGVEEAGIPHELLGRVYALSINFIEVKVRIGQDVHSLPLKARRKMSTGLTSGECDHSLK